MSRIAIIGEGEKTEKRIVENLQKTFPFDNVTFISFKAEVYQLWQDLQDDPDLEIIELLREKNSKTLKGLTADDFSDIFLFFDFDSHALKNGHKKKDINTVFTNLLEMFDNSTNFGQLYISYPMVESLWNVHELDCKRVCERCVCVEEIYAKKGYKGQLKENSVINKNIKKINQNDWICIIKHFMQKTCCLFDKDVYDAEAFTQKDIYEKQYDKYYKPNKSIMTLSAFHFFIIDYFGQKSVQQKFLQS